MPALNLLFRKLRSAYADVCTKAQCKTIVANCCVIFYSTTSFDSDGSDKLNEVELSEADCAFVIIIIE